MKQFIALFRGINVGGKNILPMKELVNTLMRNGFKDVKTYIQSGNVVISSKEEDTQKIAIQICSIIKNEYRFEPKVLILEIEELKTAIKNNPFPECESEPKSLHLGFLSEEPKNPDIAGLEANKKENERYSLIGKILYLSAPEGIGKSKLAAKSERLLGVSMTDRNWRTVCKIRDMITR